MSDLRERIAAAIDRAEDNAMRRLNGVPMVGCGGLHDEPMAVLRRCASDRRVLERHAPDNDSDPDHPTTWCVAHDQEVIWRDCPDIRDCADRWGVEA